MTVWTTKIIDETVPISFVLRFSHKLFSRWVSSSPDWDEESDPLADPIIKQMIELLPMTVMLLQDGQCIALTIDGLHRYPSWMYLEYFTDANIEMYEASLPPLPDLWDAVSCPYGPPSE